MPRLGTVHKRRPQSGGFVQCGHFSDKGEGGSSDAGLRTFWRKKIRNFRNLWCVRIDKWGKRLISSDILRQGGGGQFFAILCGRFLWTAPYT